MFTRTTPIKILGSDTENINLSSLSGYNIEFFDSYKRDFKTPNNPYIRRRIFGMYNTCRDYITQAASYPSLEVSSLIKTIIRGFYNTKIETMRANFDNLNNARMSEIQLRCKDILKRLFKSDNVLLTFDSRKEIKPIKIFLDYIHEYSELRHDPLNFTWNQGFFKFSNPNNIVITLIISTEYIKSLLNSNYTDVIDYTQNATNELTNNGSGIVKNNDDIMTLGENYKIDLQVVANKFWKDLLKAFTVALYVERYRENAYAQIHTILKIFEKEKTYNYETAYCINKTDFADKIKKYVNDINATRCFYKLEDTQDDTLKPGFLTSTRKQLIKQLTGVNAIDFYKTLFEPLTIEINTIKDKLRVFDDSTVINQNDYIDSKIDDLNEDYGVESTNLIVSTLLIKRLVPIIIYTEFIMNNGSKYNAVKQLFDRFDRKLLSLSFSSANNVTTKYIDRIIKLTREQIALVSKNINVLVDSKKIRVFFSNLCFESDIFEDKFLDKDPTELPPSQEEEEQQEEEPII